MAMLLCVGSAMGQTVNKLIEKWKAIEGAQYQEVTRDSLLKEMVKDDELVVRGISEKEIAFLKKNLKRLEQVTLKLDEDQRKELDEDIKAVKGYELLFVVNENDEPEDGGNLLQQMWNQVMTSKSQISVYGKVEKNVVDGVLLRWDIWNQVVLGHLDGKMKVEILSKALSLDGGLVEIDRNEDDVVDMKKVLKEVEAGNVLFVMDGEEHPELHSVNEAKAYMDSINFHHSHETWIVGGGVKEKYPLTDKKVVIEWERSEADKMSDAELKEAVMNCVVLINGEYRPEFHNENEVIKYLSDEDGAFNVPDYRVNIHFNQEKAAKYDKTKKVVTEITYTEKKKDE